MMSMQTVETLEQEISDLKENLKKKEECLQKLKSQRPICPYSKVLTSEEVTRYSRQIITPQIKLHGQIDLKHGKVLIVGAGGLGCPASLYLAAAGVGEVHIIDYDVVELSNLHRQILHYESDIGLPKVQSVCDKLHKINSNIKVFPLQIHADSSITENIRKNKYDVVLDCTDNVPTRYLLNDVCVLHNIPLVSGSALQMEGQLTVYHYGNGPCYRCLFPVPPPAFTVTNCGDGGVLGAVPGTIGVLQALETIKILTKSDGVLSGRLLLFDGSESNFRTVKLRYRNPSCDICGDNPKITVPVDYEQFCGSKADDKVVNIDVLKPDESVNIKDFTNILETGCVILDVRPELEYLMCKLPNTINIPYTEIAAGKATEKIHQLIKTADTDSEDNKIYTLCRRGNDSQRAVETLKNQFHESHVKFINVKGGLYAYSRLVDNSFPVY